MDNAETKEKTIYVYHLDEGVDVWRPVQAVQVRENVYEIISENPDPEDEKWQFSKGDLVKCKFKSLAKTTVYQDYLVAIEKIGK